MRSHLLSALILRVRGGSLRFPGIVRGHADRTPIFAFPYKPGLCPDQPLSPRITARHGVGPPGKGGVAQSISRHKRADAHESRLCQSRDRSSLRALTVQIDDAGVGDLLHGVVVGVHRKETGEFHYDMIPVSFFQTPSFGKKMYQKKATELALNLLYQMRLGENEEIEICSSFLFDETRPHLAEKYGKTRVKTAVITGDAQNNVETAYLDEIRNLGYEPIAERDDRRARSFFHMLKWVKNNPERLRYAKTGWPRLRRYINLPRKHDGPGSTR